MYTVSEQDISNTVNDFMTFCDFLEQHNPKLSDRKAVLGKNDLFALNKILVNKKEVSAPNYMQESYPVIDLMFNLAVLGKLYLKTGDGKGKVLLTSTERKVEFDNLNLFEKYAFLLETFWTQFDIELYLRYCIDNIGEIVKVFKGSMPEKKLYKGAFSKNPDRDAIYSYNAVLIHYFSFYGMCNFTLLPIKGKSADKYLDSIDSIVPSKFGVNICKILYNLKIIKWNVPYLEKYGDLDFYIRDEDREDRSDEDFINVDIEAHPFYKYLEPIFPEGTVAKTVLAAITKKVIKGNYIFKVSLEKTVWRMISIGYNHSLDDLHMAIQDAFDFDNDHLYSFFMDGKRYSRDRYESPDCEDGPYADEAIIGDLGLYTGQKILYLFDYGDSWEFGVQLVKINEGDEPVKKPRVIDSKGEAPEQYPYWEEDDDEDDEEDEDLEEDDEVEGNG